MKKIAKILLISIVSLVAVLYIGVFLGHHVIFPENRSEVPTIEAVADGQFLFGPTAHSNQPTTVEEYILVLASHLSAYNSIAEEIWPGNALVDLSLIVEDVGRKQFYHIDYEGNAEQISKDEAMSFDIQRMPEVNGFSAFDGGMYLAITEQDMTNYLNWQKYLHFGMYDPFLFFTHEGFHMEEQPKWSQMETISNMGRDEYMENIEARTLRYRLQCQLLEAVSHPDDTERILEALATYEYWKESFPEDFENSIYFDRIEGTAYYFELLTGLYAAYPDQIQDKESLDSALALLAIRDDIYTGHGLISEAYYIGGFTGVLLDRVDADWKQVLMDDGDATPISLLYSHFEGENLPPVKALSQQEMDDVLERIHTPDPDSNKGMPLFFRFLYDMLW